MEGMKHQGLSTDIDVLLDKVDPEGSRRGRKTQRVQGGEGSIRGSVCFLSSNVFNIC